MALYGWPNETIDMLSQKYQQQDPEARAQLLRPEYLPNWSDLAKITGCKIVRKKKLIECSNSLSSLSSTCKTTVSCLTKSNWVNTVKVFLALHDDESILRIFDAPTGLTYGTSCPTAPIWWTPAHDLKFLKLVVKYGTVWKTILEVAEAGEFPHSLLQPDPTFAMPADTSSKSLTSLIIAHHS